MNRAMFVGSFDPVTYGHVDIIKRSSSLYDEMIVVVSASTAKKYLFSTTERIEMITEALEESSITNYRVLEYNGLTADLAKKMNINVMIRGIRSVKDLEYERDIADLNRIQYPEAETLCLISDAKYQSISSTMVKEIAYYGGVLDQLVPSNVEEKLREVFNKEERPE